MVENFDLGSGYKEYVGGMLAGVAMVIVGHPFDTVKVKLQKHNAEGNGIKYKNGLHCTARILKTEGVKGLYRGATSSFVGMAFESSLVFGIYSQAKQFLQVCFIIRGWTFEAVSILWALVCFDLDEITNEMKLQLYGSLPKVDYTSDVLIRINSLH